jgi:hypothetical protein
VTEEDVLYEVIGSLNSLGLPYALTGGLAVSFYGHPRSTHDFDLVIQFPAKPGAAKDLLKIFEKDFYISEAGVIDAVLHKTMFNIIHHETGLKIDLWILKDGAYDREAFKRRKTVKALGTELSILSPEDMMINKLLWYKVSDLQKHFNDAKSIYEIQKGGLDLDYLAKWTLKLAINDLFKKITE